MNSEVRKQIRVRLVGETEGAFAADLERETDRIEVVSGDVDTVVDAVDSDDIDCVVSVLSEGLALLRTVREVDPDLPFVLVVPDGSEGLASDAVAAGVSEYLPGRPADLEAADLAERIERAVDRYRAGRRRSVALDRYERVAAVSSDAVWDWEPETGTVHHLRGFEDEFGVTPDDGADLFEWWTDRVHPEDREAVVRSLERAIAECRDDYEDSYRFRRGDGTYATVLARGSAVESGEATRMVGTLTDVSDEIEYHARFREFIEHSRDTITIVGADGTVRYVSPSIETVTARPWESFVDEDVMNSVHPDDRERVYDTFLPLVENPEQQAGPVQYRVRNDDGEWVWVESVAASLDPESPVDGFVVNTRNVTERRERMESLHTFRQAVEHAGHAIYITDREGTIEYVNPAFEDLTDYPADEAVGETPAILNSGEHDEDYYADLWETVLSGDIWRETVVNHARSGERYTAVQTIAPIRDADGEVSKFVAVQQDITDAIVREQRLSVLNRVLRHNLRNDLNVVSGRIELLRNRLPDDPAVQTAVDDVRETVDGLLAESEKARTIHSLLMTDDVVPTPPSMVLRAVERTLDDRFPDADVRYEATAGDDTTVDGRVEQALTELVENAVEHSGTDVRVRVTAGEATDGRVEFLVSDTGPGIPDYERQVLERGSETDLEHSEGLGLWLVSWLVGHLGGSVAFEDAADWSTVVRIRVPQGVPDTA